MHRKSEIYIHIDFETTKTQSFIYWCWRFVSIKVFSTHVLAGILKHFNWFLHTLAYKSCPFDKKELLLRSFNNKSH